MRYGTGCLRCEGVENQGEPVPNAPYGLSMGRRGGKSGRACGWCVTGRAVSGAKGWKIRASPSLTHPTQLLPFAYCLLPIASCLLPLAFSSNKCIYNLDTNAIPLHSLKIGKTQVIGLRSSTVTLTVVVVPGEISNWGPREDDH